MARGGSPLDFPRGAHPRAPTGRAAPRGGSSGGQQGAQGVHGGAWVRRCRQLGLRSGAQPRRMGERRAALADRASAHPPPRARTRLGCCASPKCPPPWPGVSAMVIDWISEVQALGREGEGIEPAALAKVHARFEQIHPFLDGNGRTGRLVLNLLLVRLGYPPAIIFKGDRRRYLAALQSADQGDHGPLGELLARAILDNLHKFVVPAIAGPSRLVPLPALATERISANALRVAATRGRLKASKVADGTWRSTRVWVDEYLAGRYERDPRDRSR